LALERNLEIIIMGVTYMADTFHTISDETLEKVCPEEYKAFYSEIAELSDRLGLSKEAIFDDLAFIVVGFEPRNHEVIALSESPRYKVDEISMAFYEKTGMDLCLFCLKNEYVCMDDGGLRQGGFWLIYSGYKEVTEEGKRFQETYGPVVEATVIEGG
jgi:hypothetical protein